MMSDKLNYLLRNCHKPYMRMLEGIAYIRNVSNDLNHALFDFSCFNAEVFEIDDPCIFLGSRQNYGHWFQDYLSKFYIIEKFEHLKDMPIIFGKLKDFQKESLEILGIDKRNIIELSPPDGKRCSLYKFKKVFIPSNIPSGVGKSFLYKRFVKQIPQENRKRRLYLSRKNDGDRRRVYNEEEVSLWLERLGFEIIIPEVLSTKDTIEIFSQAEMIVSSMGAHASNMMFTDKCPLILLAGSRLMETRDFGLSAALQLFFPMCDFIVPVVGTLVVESRNWNIIDDLCVFRIEDIEWGISEAENFLKKSDRNTYDPQGDKSMEANITKYVKPIDNPDHISLLLPTRGRPVMLQNLFDSIKETTLDKRLIDLWVYVDEDDELTRSFIDSKVWIKYGFDINWIVEEKLNVGPGQLDNELWKKCAANSGIYMGLADDYIFVTKHWDEVVRQAFRRYPDRILLAYPEDPVAPGVVTFVILSAEWLNISGRLFPEYFPFWFVDAWIDQVAQMIQRKVKLDMRMEPQGGKGKTQGMKNLVFWDRFFDNMLDERINEADALRRAIYPPESQEYQKSVQEAQVIIQQARTKPRKSDATLIAMEKNYALKSSDDPIKDASYFIFETNALNNLFKRFRLLYAQNRIDESLDILDNISQSSLLKSYETAYMRSIVLKHSEDNKVKSSEVLEVTDQQISGEPLYINRLKQKVISYRQNPSDQGIGADLRQERRKIAETFLNTPREKIGDMYQTYIGEAYNLLLSSGLQGNPPGSEDQSLLTKIMPGIRNSLTESVLAAAYSPLMDRNLTLAGNERSFITHILSALQKRDDAPHLLQFILVALLFLKIEVKKG